MDEEVHWSFDDVTDTVLRDRRGVAIPTEGTAASHKVSISHQYWAFISGEKLRFIDGLNVGDIKIDGDEDKVKALISAFDHPSFKQ